MKKTILLLLLFIIVLTNCKLAIDYQYELHMYNNTSNTISACFTYDINDTFCYSSLFPDTLLPLDKSSVFIEPIKKKAESSFYCTECSYDKWFDSDTDKISIFVFSQDTLNKYSWAEIRESYNILIRYDLTYEDISKLDYTIPYPPTEDMKEMQMYPPYKE